jgi:hypothetical protein
MHIKNNLLKIKKCALWKLIFFREERADFSLPGLWDKEGEAGGVAGGLTARAGAALKLAARLGLRQLS